MGKSSDQLRQEIDRQRDDAGAKIDRLQAQVHGEIEGTREQVMGTAEQVRDTAEQVRDEAQAVVSDTVETVKHSVESIDIERHVQERPLMSVGLALVGGFVLGGMMGGEHHQQHRQGGYSGASSTGGGHDMSSVVSGVRSAAQKSGLEDTIENAAAALMGSVTEQFKRSLDRTFPGFSEKLDTAEHQKGSFAQKARATQHEAERM